MSVLEIILYIGLGLFAIIMIAKTIIKEIKYRKGYKNFIKSNPNATKKEYRNYLEELKELKNEEHEN